MAGAGLIKATLALAATLHWTGADSTTYTILNAAGDSVFYYLPIVLAISAARRFKANEITSVAIAGAWSTRASSTWRAPPTSPSWASP